jgi:hypothetical protein
MALNEKTIKAYIEDSLKKRNQYEDAKELLDLIYTRVLPEYENTPFWSSNKLRQLRKMYFVEYAVQECDLLKYKVHIPDLLFATVCTDIALVEDEFRPLYRIKNLGIESARVTKDKFKDILVDHFNYKPYDETASIIPSIRAFQTFTSVNNLYTSKVSYNQPMYSSYLYDIHHLSEFFTIGFSGYMKTLMHDKMYLAGIDIVDATAEEEDKFYNLALNELKALYGRSGTYTIQSKVFAESPKITELYNKMKELITKAESKENSNA